MKRIPFALILALVTVAAFALPRSRAVADDETNDTEIRIRAPLDAADCSATPPTITVLGLTIDVSTAAIEVQGGDSPGVTPTAGSVSGDDSAGGRHGGSKPPSSTGCYYSCPPTVTPTPTTVTTASSAAPASGSCTSLVVGQPVEVRLASDAAPLSAARVQQDSGNDNIEIQAPVQGFDSTAQTVTVLGLVVDTSAANLEGSDDNSTDGNSQPIDLSQLVIGQFVEMRLASSTAPFVATELQVKNFSNQVSVEVDDSSRQAVSDEDQDGNPVDDVEVDVVETVAVQPPVAGSTPTRRIRKVVRLHTSSNGSFTLNGLPTGSASIFVTRVNGGQTSVGRRSLRVRANTNRPLHIILRPAR